jgi:acetyltransferase-like isoleucine patch superfamily enzyme
MGLNNKLERADYSAETFRLLRRWQRSWLHLWYTSTCRLSVRLMGVKLGKNVSFNGKIRIERFKHSTIEIGDGVTFNSHELFNQLSRGRNILETMTDHAFISIGKGSGFSSVRIKAEEGISIGNHVTVGANTVIMDTDSHPEITGKKATSIHIEDDVFIGMNCCILKGVTIGEGAIIGAGSIVTKDVPANSIAAGVPCRVIRMKF